MKKFKITIAYDGTDFFGWQIQPTAITITSCLEQTFFNVFNEKISIIGASRTDTGVHALGQVATFYSTLSLQEHMIQKAWNDRLPRSIYIRKLNAVYEKFHPCNNVLQKTYLYHLFLQKPLPFVARYGWNYQFIHHVNMPKFNSALALYQGTHNFGSFCKVEDEKKTTIRTIDTITIKKLSRWNILQITIKGKSFLRYQIRRMIGYALDVARQPKLSLSYLQDILNNPNPQQTLVKAESCGLCLRKVVYNDEVFNK